MTPSFVAAVAWGATVLLVGWWWSWRLAPARDLGDRTFARPTVPVAARRARGLGVRGRVRRRGAGPDETMLANWCQRVASGLRSGSSLPSAFADACGAVPEVGAVFTPVTLAMDRGASLSRALDRVHHDDDSIGLATATVRTCARLGGPAAEPLDRVAATLHGRAGACAERRVHSAQAELSAKVLTALPLVVLALLAATDADVRRALTLPSAQLCLTVGLALDVGGWWWMRRIITAPATRRTLRPSRRTQLAASRSLPDGIEVLVSCLHAGLTPPQLVDEVVDDLPKPLRPAFGAVRDRMARGHRFADAVAELPKRLGAESHGLADSMSAADRYGLPLAPVLDRLSFEAAAARRRQGEADARRLPVRLSFPLVMTTLPSFVLIAIAPAVIGAVSTFSVPPG